jgi:RimJ/RimL family protein N-acetyltransferase
MIFLETERLIFRSHQPVDEQDFVEMHTDPEVRRFVGGAAWTTEKALYRFRHQYLGRPNKTYGLWATVYKEDGKYIGCCGLRKSLGENTPSLGYYIARPYWGRGLASEAANAFIALAFRRLRCRRLLADVEKGNGASERILQKFGFQFFRQEEISGRGRIICFYELLKSEWPNRNP